MMIMPTKIIKPVDSLICISSEVLNILKTENLLLDELFEKLNDSYYKKVSMDTLFLCLDFLYLIDKIEQDDATLKVKF